MTSIPDALMIWALDLIFSNVIVSTDFTGRVRYSGLPKLPGVFLLSVKMWHQQKIVKSLLGEAFIAVPVPDTTLGAAVVAALSFGWSRSSEAERITSGMEQC